MLVGSTKYDGSLHYRYSAALVQAAPEALMLYLAPGTVLTSYRGELVAKQHTLQIYWPDRWYNLHINWQTDWQARSHYVNIATPASWRDTTLHFIDLDLDVIWRAQTGELILDDEDEFLLHQARFGYPADLIERCWQSCAEVQDLITRRVRPFDGSLYAWRPHGAP